MIWKKFEKKRGFCEKCNEPLGSIDASGDFCYKCREFQITEIQQSIRKYTCILEILKQKFRNNLHLLLRSHRIFWGTYRFINCCMVFS